jgi:hypothetical protein
MVTEAEKLISEIKQIKEQYQAEVGSKRKPWPNSIQDRIKALDKMGYRLKAIAHDTGVPYHTILQWRFQANKKLKSSNFQELTVQPKSLVQTATATVPTLPQITSTTVTVTTPLGYRIEGSAESINKILKSNHGRL